MMKRIGVSLLKILAFLGVWTLLIGAVVMSAVLIGGRDWYLNSGWRAWVEVGGAIAVLAALIFMALVVDKRGLDTIGFTADRAIFGMLGGALLGAAIFRGEAMRIVPSLDDPISKATTNKIPIYLVVYPAPDGGAPQMTIEFSSEGKPEGRSSVALPAPDPDGRIRILAPIPVDRFGPGRHELKVTVRQGSALAEEKISFTLQP